MFTKSARKLTKSLVDNEVIPESEFEAHCIGFEMSFAIAANIVTTLAIGFAFRMPLESLLFLAAIIPLRSYAGGYHASSHFRCYLFSIVAVIAILSSMGLILSMYSAGIFMGAGVVCATIMFFLAPVQHPNRPLIDSEVYISRQRARIILCIETFALAAFLALGWRVAASILLCTMLLVCVSACVGAVMNYLRQADHARTEG